MATFSQESENADNYSCTLCLEVYEKPVTIISCNHTFCKSCLAVNTTVAVAPICPICRQEFNPKQVSRDKQMEKSLASRRFTCWACNSWVSAPQMKSHTQKCLKVKEQVSKLQIASSNKKSGPNRSTFSCPICGQANLDTFGLVKHAESAHRQSPHNSSVVCPICAAMPWGSNSQKTSDFVGHLLKRHNFEYHTYVDYEADEESVLSEVLARSMLDR
ncbi:E3 ubiquitin-protein ligase RNF166-like [Convolutriloba macropyga]|uniref:E3 ubiquitin-protein ligase RNF166-like n=1 Tax=Convolutriloba macropyga TaxID=536237 RepID=UPI003F528D6D